jgi:lysophospholipase L1-like esterase
LLPPRTTPRPGHAPRVPRFILAAVSACLTALPLVLATAATPASAATVNYVGMGDSYASGLGAGNLSGGSCDRSSGAADQLWANTHSPASFAFVACAGATTADIINSQVSALSSSTTLVSVTIGGNDVGFSDVMATCVLSSTSSCVSAVSNAENEAQTQLPAELDNAYNAIRSHAPNAKVVVVGYPEFYDLAKSSSCIGLSTQDRTALNGGADVLDSVIQAAAARHGFTWSDVRSAFAGHEICDSSSWLHSTNFLDISESYHPTASGQSGAYLPVLTSGIG